MPSRPGSGVKVVRKRLADGTIREYRYARAAPPEAPDAGSMAALLAGFRGSPEFAALSPRTQDQYRIYLRPWDEPEWARFPVREVTRRHILAIRDALAAPRVLDNGRRAGGLGAATAFGRVTGALFAWALDRGWIEHTPAGRIKALAKGRLPDWGEDAIALALDKLPEACRRVVVLGLYTGQRRGDLARLTWGQVREGRILLTQGKTGQALSLPIHPTLAAELAGWRGAGRVGPILLSERGKPWTDNHLSREMGHQLGKIGLRGLNVHGLRKAAARRLAEAGCTPHEIAAITGHQTLAMVQHYTRAADQAAMATGAVVKLQGAVSSTSGNRETKRRK